MKMNRQNLLLLLATLFVYFLGFNLDVMDIDAAQYANMSREMLQSNNPLFLYDVGMPYLDKPPFLIWVSALSMKLFGVNNIAYRIPSFLFALLALYATYGFAKIYYHKKIAILSAVILATCQGFFLMNHDVRTDTILMSWVIISIWQLSLWFNSGKWTNFLLGFIAIGGGMLTKGPIALFVPIFAFGSHFLLQRNFKMILKWQYIAGIAVIAVVLLPMSIGLYLQFDKHPELVVNDQTNISGLRFFYWTQSFGRITGESTWNNNSNIFFLLQNMLWAFLPWIIFFLIGVYKAIAALAQQRFKLLTGQEAITTGGFIITYLSLGISKYQLPHYIYIVFPFAAIITANYLYNLIYQKKWPVTFTVLYKIHVVLFSLLLAALTVLLAFTLPGISTFFVVLSAGAFAALLWWIFTQPKHLLLACIFTSITINFFTNAAFYPALLKFQMGSNVGRFIYQQQLPADSTFIFRYREFKSIHFYARQNIYHKDSTAAIQAGNYIITSKRMLPLLDSAGLTYTSLHTAVHFPVSRLSIKFLNPKTRLPLLDSVRIVKIIQ